MSEKRVLQVIGIMNRGGAETMIMNMYRNIDREKVQFDFVVHTDQKAAYDDEIISLGGRIYHCPRFDGKNIFQYKKWWQDFFSGSGQVYGIVHGHIGSTAAIYLKIAAGFGKFTIAHSHSSGTDHSLKQFAYRMLSYNTRNVADDFFACSKIAGIDRYGKKIVNNEKCFHLLNNAIDAEQFCYDKERRDAIRKSLGIDSKEIVIGHVGRFSKEKNHIFILKVFEEFLNLRGDAKLVLVGMGPLQEEIKNCVKQMGLGEKVFLLGVRQDVSDLMMGMDAFLFPSIYEGLPVVLVEAQATGLPCLISDAVPSESILCSDLIKTRKLTEQVDKWAETLAMILDQRNIRFGRANEIKKAGYDVKETAHWLEDYYVSKYPR